MPDLAFSELAFLNSHKQGPQVPNEGSADTRKRRKKSKAVDTEAEMSRYFRSKVPGPCKKSVDAEVSKKQGPVLAHSAYQDQGRSGNCQMSPKSSPPPVDLPDRPYLGFGSSGACLSPVKLTHDLDDLPSLPEKMRSGDPSNPNSSGYYTWSQSSVPSCSPVRRCSKTLITRVDQGAPETTLQQKRFNERSKKSATSATTEPRNEMNRDINVVEEHFERPFHHHQQHSRDAKSADDTKASDLPQLPAKEPLKDSIQFTDDCDTIEGLSKKAFGTTPVAEVNQPKTAHVERSPCPGPTRVPLVHDDPIGSLDVALDTLPHTCEPSPLESLKPITASKYPALSYQLPVSRYPDVPKPTRINEEGGALLTSHKNEAGDSNFHRDLQTQDNCNCSPTPAASPSPKLLYWGFQDGEREYNSSNSAAALALVEKSRTSPCDSARHPQAPRLDRGQQRPEYLGGAWNAYQSMYENQKTEEYWHDCSFNDSTWRSNSRAYEPKLEIGPSIKQTTYTSSEDLHDEQRLGMAKQPNVAEVHGQSYKLPQNLSLDQEALDGHLRTYAEGIFPLYHNMPDIGSHSYGGASSFPEDDHLYNFWKPNRLY